MGKGRKNLYTCTKGHGTATIDVDEGVTPFMIQCEHEDCNEMAKSHFYNVSESVEPEFEWYRPHKDEYLDLEKFTQEHVENGGLIMRPIGERRCKNAEMFVNYCVGIVTTKGEVKVKLHNVTAKNAVIAVGTALIEVAPENEKDNVRRFVQSELNYQKLDDVKKVLATEYNTLVEIVKI